MGDVAIVWTGHGIAAVGTVSPAFAAQAWREHLEANVPVSEHGGHRLDELDRLRGSRRWLADDGVRAPKVHPNAAAASVRAREALVLIGTYRGRAAADGSNSVPTGEC